MKTLAKYTYKLQCLLLTSLDGFNDGMVSLFTEIHQKITQFYCLVKLRRIVYYKTTD